jgi:hypothetical protein
LLISDASTSLAQGGDRSFPKRCSRRRFVDEVGGPVELLEFLLEAGVVDSGRILGQDLLKRRPERAHELHASERVFPEQ